LSSAFLKLLITLTVLGIFDILRAKKKASPHPPRLDSPLKSNFMTELYHNTSLYFKASGDASELFEHKLPIPHYYHRYNADSYAIAWLVEGFFHTAKGIDFLNDIIARISLTMPIEGKYDHEPEWQEDIEPIKLQAFQNAKSMRTEYAKQAIKRDNSTSRDMVWWSIKAQTESFIRQFDGWFNYDLLETWALNLFLDHVKDKSTLRAKCRATWHWYEKRDFTIPKTDRGFIMSRSENMKRVNEQRKLEVKQKILEASKALTVRKKNGKLNITAIAEQTGLNRDTVSKYLKELGLV